jgi:putative addiction module component (TIGR02574 family)
MSSTIKELGLERLTASQRIALALELWESLGEERPHGVVTPELEGELRRRDAELDANPGMALTWEQIKAHVERKR